MKIAIMQPYLFPYIGYFQLIDAVDVFVIYDDVNYIKGGWINRNFILNQSKSLRITLPLDEQSPNKLINQISIKDHSNKLLETIRHSYAKAPCFHEASPLIQRILMNSENNLAQFLTHQLKEVIDYLGIKIDWRISSSINKDNTLHGQEKVIAICEELGATHYINAIGGKELYDHESFEKRGIELSFIQSEPITYTQFTDFVPNLSIIDVLMFNTPSQISKLIKNYHLI
ncbi:WbqC family protein [Undibacterium sp. Xuan67W]|uniref:WbqC family protein n=1 Tax=Undibacterium sp. Xuan67W TaxID=3413057 RepID=UPI003BF413CA